jgi:hypothetical protein
MITTHENATTSKTFRRHGSIRQHQTHLSVWEEKVDERAMRRVLRGMLARLSSRGWHVERDPQVLTNFPSIADRHWYGRKGDLQMVAETHGRACKIEFFQEAERGKAPNPNGGRYDFDKFNRMPRRLRLAFCVEAGAVVEKLRSYGYTSDSHFAATAKSAAHGVMLGAIGMDPAADPLAHFNVGWSSDRFERDETGWPTVAEYDRLGRNRDRDGVPVRNGEHRYFRAGDGYLRRGVVFTNMNEMWMVVHGAGVDWVSSRELFQCERPDLEPRRLVARQRERLAKELNKAVAARSGSRIAAIAKVLDCVGWPAGEQRR